MGKGEPSRSGVMTRVWARSGQVTGANLESFGQFLLREAEKARWGMNPKVTTWSVVKNSRRAEDPKSALLPQVLPQKRIVYVDYGYGIGFTLLTKVEMVGPGGLEPPTK